MCLEISMVNKCRLERRRMYVCMLCLGHYTAVKRDETEPPPPAQPPTKPSGAMCTSVWNASPGPHLGQYRVQPALQGGREGIINKRDTFNAESQHRQTSQFKFWRERAPRKYWGVAGAYTRTLNNRLNLAPPRPVYTKSCSYGSGHGAPAQYTRRITYE